ncbi:hypothetical protein B7760_05805 (plasmid) [Burkholderia glumae]|nr:hypothetical protein B7760_05805 [Burkholderia glumae]
MLEYQIEVLMKAIAQRAFGDEIESVWHGGDDIELEVLMPSLRYALREAFDCGRSVK